MTVLDQHNRSLSVAEANDIAVEESEGRLGIVEKRGEVFAVYRRIDEAEGRQSRTDYADASAAAREIPMSRLALTAWGVFEMARAAGPRPERMVHGRSSRDLQTQLASL